MHLNEFKFSQILLGDKKATYLCSKIISTLREALEVFKRHQRKQKSRLICTWGHKGAGAIDQNGQVLFVQAELVCNIIDSCGAGDTFVACVIASLIKGRSLKTALETGCRIAAKKIGQRGFQNLGDLFF